MTRLDRFKDDRRAIDKMLKATLYIQRSTGRSSAEDDVIHMYDDDEYRDMIRITYSTPELKKASEFYMTVPQTLQYLGDTLKTLTHDAQPFEHVQVSTSLHPSVLYHVSDLDCCQVRHLIEDTVETALRRPLFRVKKSQQ
jgi:hypothetical protein